MTTIEQHILIPATSHLIWDYIQDLNNNPRWQANCKAISFLTSKHEGKGTRWRSTPESGGDQVLEISAWYQGLGYEYHYVDGVPYQENVGRIRLQEIAEGTVVQWTFSYEVAGMLGGLRGGKRQVDRMMEDSLKKLYLQMKARNSGNMRESKALMQDAPDPDARANYKPRYPSLDPEELGIGQARPIDSERLQPVSPIYEPPVTDEDTRPRAAVTAAEVKPADSSIPADLARFAPPQNYDQNTVPLNPSKTTDEFTQLADELDAFVREMDAAPPNQPGNQQVDNASFWNEVDHAFNSDPFAAPGLPPSVLPTEPLPTEPLPKTVAPEERSDSAAGPFSSPTTAQNLPPVPDSTTKMDTAQVSIWEVFGMPRPSETQQMRAVEAESETVEEEAVISVSPDQMALPEPELTESALVEFEAPEPESTFVALVEPDGDVVALVETYGPTDPIIIVRSFTLTDPYQMPRRSGLRSYLRRRIIKLRRP